MKSLCTTSTNICHFLLLISTTTVLCHVENAAILKTSAVDDPRGQRGHLSLPPISPMLPARPLPWFLIPASLTKSGLEKDEQKNHIPSRPQLALVPVVDHDQPFVMFWYPVHPQIPIENLKHNKMLDPLGQAWQERQRFGCLDTWPCNYKQTPSLRSPIENWCGLLL